MSYGWMMVLRAFLVGGAICAVCQILIDKTKLTPARILTGLVCVGVVLGLIGVYEPLTDFAGAGATVPLLGFGYNMFKGVKEAISSKICKIKLKEKFTICTSLNATTDVCARHSPD